MIGAWKSYLLERAEEWGVPASGVWRPIVYNNYHPHCSDVDVFWFHNNDNVPSIVTKISNRPGPAEREYRNLRQVRPLAEASVPRPLDFSVKDGASMLWMEGLPGVQFRGVWDSEALFAVVDMVSSIHLSVSERVSTRSPQRWERAVRLPLSALAQFGTSEAVREGCARLVERAGADWLNSLAVVPQHGDFYVGNVLSDGNQWYAVDWESFGLVDLPVYDVYTFVLSLLRTDGNVSSGWDREIMARIPAVVARYVRALRLTGVDLQCLLPLTLANWFYIQWSDDRREFSERLYETIRDYFEHITVWEGAFLPDKSLVL